MFSNDRNRRDALDEVRVLFFHRTLGIRGRRPVMIYYGALPFARIEGGFAPCEAIECPHAAEAVRRAEAMSRREGIAGAVAFSRRSDPNVGEFEEAEILKSFGDVPEDFRGMT
jgi:hypothetical protein